MSTLQGCWILPEILCKRKGMGELSPWALAAPTDAQWEWKSLCKHSLSSKHSAMLRALCGGNTSIVRIFWEKKKMIMNNYGLGLLQVIAYDCLPTHSVYLIFSSSGDHGETYYFWGKFPPTFRRNSPPQLLHEIQVQHPRQFPALQPRLRSIKMWHGGSGGTTRV